MKPTPLLILLVGLATATTLEAKWQRAAIAKSIPISLTTPGTQAGATIDSSNGVGQPQSLLSSDVASHASLAAGNSSVVIKFAKPQMVTKSSFANDGVEGRATVSGSADNKSWAVLDEKVFTSADREISFAFAGIQVKYVKLEFALSKGGTIRALQILGSEGDGDYTVKQSADGKSGSPVNFASVGGSRVIYASPKPTGGIDTAATFNKFDFPESDERYRTIIYDLGQLRIMNEFGSVHSPRPVRFEVFAFDALPEKEDWRGRLAFDPAEFNVKEPVAAAEDTRGLGYIKAKPAKSVKTRYVAMRWEPEFNPPMFSARTPQMTGFGQLASTPGSGGFGAGAANSPVTGNNPAQNASQQNAAQNDPQGGGQGTGNNPPGQGQGTNNQGQVISGGQSLNGVGLNIGNFSAP